MVTKFVAAALLVPVLVLVLVEVSGGTGMCGIFIFGK